MAYYRVGNDLKHWMVVNKEPSTDLRSWCMKFLLGMSGFDSDNGYSEYLEIDDNGERTYAIASFTYGLGNPNPEDIGAMEEFAYGKFDAITRLYGKHSIKRSPYSPTKDWLFVKE